MPKWINIPSASGLFLAVCLFLATGMFFAVSSSWAVSSSSGSASAINREDKLWYRAQDLVERLYSEQWKVNKVRRELKRLRTACENVLALREYPNNKVTSDGGQDKRIQKKLKKIRDRADRTEILLNELEEPLLNGLQILEEMLKDRPNEDMMSILAGENIDRIQQVIQVKKFADDMWGEIEEVLGIYEAAYGLERREEENALFESKFFEVLIRQIGKTSEIIQTRLDDIRDAMSDAANLKQKKAMAKRDFKRLLSQMNAVPEESFVAELERMSRRYEKDFPIGGVQFYLGKSYLNQGENQKAVHTFSQVAPTSSYYGNAQLGILETYFAMGMMDSVVVRYRKMEALPDSLSHYTKYLAVQGFFQLKMDDDVERVILSFNRMSEVYYKSLLVYSKSLVRRQKDLEAVHVLKQIIKHRSLPQTLRSKAELSLAFLKIELKHYDRALNDFKGLIDRPRFHPDALFGMVWCYIHMGDTPTAELTLKKLINQYPDSHLAVDGILLLAKWKFVRATHLWKYKRQTDSARYLLQEVSASPGESPQSLSHSRRRVLSRKAKRQRKILEKRVDVSLAHVDKLYRQAIRLSEYIKDHYKSGEFTEVKFSEGRNRALKKVESAIRTKRKAGVHKMGPEQVEEKILASLVLKLDMLINYYQWLSQFKDTGATDMYVTRADSLHRPLMLSERSLSVRGKISQLIDTLMAHPYSGKYTDKLLFYKGLMLYQNQKDLAKVRTGLPRESRGGAQVYHAGGFEKFWARLVENYPTSPYLAGAFYYLGKSLLEQGDVRGREMLEEYLGRFEKNPYREYALYQLGASQYLSDSLQQADSTYVKILRNPDSKHFENALYMQAWVYYKSEKHLKAVKAFAFLLGEELGKPEDQQRNLLIDESIKMLAASFAELNFSKGRIVGLIQGTFTEGRAGSLIPNVFHRLAVEYRQMGDFKKAAAILNNVIQEYPLYDYMPAAYLDLAILYDMDSEFKKAVNLKKKVFEKFNPESEWYGKLEGDRQRARVDSICEEALLGMGQHYFTEASLKKEVRETDSLSNESEYLAAIFAYEKVLETYPDRPHKPQIHYQLGEAYFAIGDYFSAAKFYLEAADKMSGKSKKPAAYNAIVASKKYLERIHAREKDN